MWIPSTLALFTTLNIRDYSQSISINHLYISHGIELVVKCLSNLYDAVDLNFIANVLKKPLTYIYIYNTTPTPQHTKQV